MMRQKVLERCGWQFFRVRGGEYYSNRVKALEPLWGIFKEHELNKEKYSELITNNNSTSNENSLTENTNIEKETDYQNDVETENIENRFAEKPVLKIDSEYSEHNDLFTNNPDLILRYFNLFKNGTYILTTENPLKADYVLPIQTSQKNGFLLQCYESGHINKVYVSTLLSRKIGKEYMNGLNQNDNLVFLTIIENEVIVGIYFYENGVKKFKAHLTENISCREQLHLQGYKVIYNKFDRVEYKFFPLRIQNEINRLIYQSFTANGKPVSNNYYEKEWSVLRRFSKKTKIPNEPETDYQVTEASSQIHNDSPDLEIKLNSVIRIKYLNKDKEINIQLVDYHAKEFETNNGVQKININSPLGLSIIGKSIGDRVEIKNTNSLIEILEVQN